MDIVKMLGNIIQKWGLIAGFHFVLFSGIIMYILKRTEKGKTLAYRIKEIFGKKPQLYDLHEHIMFTNLRKYIDYDIQHFRLSNKLREAIFKDFLLIQFITIKKHFQAFLNRGDVNLMSDELFRTRMQDCITEIVKSYEGKARSEGIPEVVIIKYNEWYESKIQAMHEFIITVCDDQDIYEDNYYKTKVIFEFITNINNLTIFEAKRTLIHLNGELNKVVYKGISHGD